MAEWTRQELEELHPDGTVSVQVDDTATVLTTEEWSAWIDAQVGNEKFEDPLGGE
jgi:trans-2-enoyl-CoA reductase